MEGLTQNIHQMAKTLMPSLLPNGNLLINASTLIYMAHLILYNLVSNARRGLHQLDATLNPIKTVESKARNSAYLPMKLQVSAG